MAKHGQFWRSLIVNPNILLLSHDALRRAGAYVDVKHNFFINAQRSVNCANNIIEQL